MKKVILVSAAVLMMGTVVLGTVGTVEANIYDNSDWTPVQSHIRGKNAERKRAKSEGAKRIISLEAMVSHDTDKYIYEIVTGYINQIKRANTVEEVNNLYDQAKSEYETYLSE
ncbi:hypothetical protein [Streptococcus pseudoporcinus]|uniref:Uncharacterized protein n=1 Tax=Streptococcus pseudoporcinus TaxID=361101 RepID=A0A4V6KZI2_9STRE|nr:hypothetical protein [Streptococcus pseudoporcinus]VTS12987.1 Uncharacterised protein [Streptococcus pseudoporcinus]VUC66154.1 Uncharacterised protein [Streptococcus pseudoporcinus]VUC97081.1 Uncharacterised protein [Streptococcus pseudoporcinus]VUC97469.1 Uncharacterised protein [Streptococcus pseudoporcinus]